MGKTPHGMGKSVFLLVLKIMGKSVIGTSEMGKSVWAKTCGQKFDGQNSVNRKIYNLLVHLNLAFGATIMSYYYFRLYFLMQL